ncbi:MAG TPA: protein-disulfide reductase DsbD domain-containing protein [Candidatus Binatia bacterium]|nr:protein-disulfide reductase DsbD domain-containing protein [Candidatus Binatia bacterium]
MLLVTALVAGSAAAAEPLLPRHAAQQDFLPVDQAFELQPLERKGGALLVRWRIAKGYYLYRDRLQFDAPGKAVLPVGEAHHDEIFGDGEMYRNELIAKLPAAETPKLTVTYQGCADAGLCYPPQTRTLELGR